MLLVYSFCVFLLLLQACCVCCEEQSLLHKTGAVSEEERISYKPPVYKFDVFDADAVVLSEKVSQYSFQLSQGIKAKSLTSNVPVYVSMTSIGKRSGGCIKMIISLLKGTVVPTHIYLFLSSDHYLIDSGLKPEDLSPDLKLLAKTNSDKFSIVFTGNIGPHRKLLPLLAEKWTEDCIIITVGKFNVIFLYTVGISFHVG